MSKKRAVLKYGLASTQAALLGAGLVHAYSRIGESRPPYNLDELKKVAVAASVFSVITFAVAKL